jgi:hypothetical protein
MEKGTISLPSTAGFSTLWLEKGFPVENTGYFI